MRTIQRLGLAALLAISPAAFADTPRGKLRDVAEPTVAVPAGVAIEKVGKALELALVIRGWRITEHNLTEKYVDAEIPLRAHVGRTRLRYTAEKVQFQYRESDNLAHGWRVLETQTGGMTGLAPQWKVVSTPQPGAIQVIHERYNEWMEELVLTIEGTLRLQQ